MKECDELRAEVERLRAKLEEERQTSAVSTNEWKRLRRIEGTIEHEFVDDDFGSATCKHCGAATIGDRADAPCPERAYANEAEVERLRAERDEEQAMRKYAEGRRRELSAALALAHEALRALIPLADEGQSAIDHTLEERLAGDLAAAIALAGRALSAPAMRRAAELDAARKRVCKASREVSVMFETSRQEQAHDALENALAELERLEAAE